MFIKIGESFNLSQENFQSASSVDWDPAIYEHFKSVAKELKENQKRIAPKADDFLYFSCVMMHAAEAALLDEHGKLRKDSSGKPLEARWEKQGESMRWVCSDPSVLPYRNSNRDIFPEEELVQAYKKWVGKPLCLDHKSSSVDMVRGIIVDTYYDRPNKRIIALCALDKKNHPQLAQQVSTYTTTCVSMGTAVGRAICTDCGVVARVESDFCNHMRTKSGYGEINAELNPIELSIVVNGADPQAKIKHIVASRAQASYQIDKLRNDLAKIAVDETGDINLAESALSKLDEAEDTLKKIREEIESLKESEEKEQEKYLEEGADNKDMTATSTATNKLMVVLASIEKKLDTVFEKISTLEEQKMSMSFDKKSYHQSGVKGNDPADVLPYPKEDADKIRDTQDKQMQGSGPFPGVGSVEGLYPGVSDSGETEEARKRRLQRLAAVKEENALRRSAALREAREKVSYHQSGVKGNDPADVLPYPKEDADKIRDTQDKQMQGQPPFPGVGAGDGLHPSPASVAEKDELKRKQMLGRASYRAAFVRAAKVAGFDDLGAPQMKDDLGNSRWNVYLSDGSGSKGKLVLTATVNELTGGNADMLFDKVATAEFGQNLVARINKDGLGKVASDLGARKVAQFDAAPASAPAPAPVPSAPPAPVSAEPKEEADKEVLDEGGSGDPKEEIEEKLNELDNLAADLHKGFSALTNSTGNELNVLDSGDLSEKTAKLASAQRKFSKIIAKGIKAVARDLNTVREDLAASRGIFNTPNKFTTSQLNYVKTLTREALDEADLIRSRALEVMDDFVKFAKSTETLVKQAELEVRAQVVMPAEKITSTVPSTAPHDVKVQSDEMKKLVTDPDAAGHRDFSKAVEDSSKPKPLTPAPAAKQEGWRPLESGSGSVRVKSDAEVQKDLEDLGMKADDSDMKDVACAEDCDMDHDHKKDENDLKMNADGSLDGSPKELGEVKKTMAGFDLSTKEGRAAARAKFAEKGMGWSEWLNKAHPGAGPDAAKFDVKPSGDLGKIEKIDEVHKAMEALVNGTVSPKVRKDAAEINELIAQGKISEADFPDMIKEGVDPAAVQYWKKYFGEVKNGGTQFAAELTREKATKKAQEEIEVFKVKYARATDLANQMFHKGMVPSDANSMKSQVDELMKYNDEGFESFARWVSKQPGKVAVAMPQVGVGMLASQTLLPGTESSHEELVRQLEGLWDK